MIGPISRIVSRWLAGGLVSLGFFAPSDAQVFATDPDIVMLVGLAIGAAAEFAYIQARKRGWNV